MNADRRTTGNPRGERKKRILFVCTANQQRSPTAEGLFRDSPTVEARSCGVGSLAIVAADPELIAWADEIYCMEDHHREALCRRFPDARSKPVRVLDVPDVYARNDPHLILQLRGKLKELLQ